jgi:hypothetical protein
MALNRTVRFAVKDTKHNTLHQIRTRDPSVPSAYDGIYHIPEVLEPSRSVGN